MGELTVVLRPEQYARNYRYKSIIHDTLKLLLEEINNTRHEYIPDNAHLFLTCLLFTLCI